LKKTLWAVPQGLFFVSTPVNHGFFAKRIKKVAFSPCFCRIVKLQFKK